MNWINEIIAGLAAAVLLPIIYRNWKRLIRWLSCNDRLVKASEAVSPSGRGLWLSSRPDPPPNYRNRIQSSIPILTIANLKGGVGKTTLAANLAASYAAKATAANDKPVLAIDLDFQGSLSSMLLADDKRLPLPDQPSKAARLLSGEVDGNWLNDAAQPILNVDNAWCVPAYYDLAAVENRLMLDWLIGETAEDIRYTLARILQSPVIQAKFSRIIIDAPPRLTTATIQALCASTQILIPTKLDVLSAEAVGTFIREIETLRDLFPDLKYVGIAGTMNMSTRVPFQAARAIDVVLEGRGYPTHLLDAGTFIPHRSLIGITAGQPPGQRIVYASRKNAAAYREIREDFDRLRDAI